MTKFNGIYLFIRLMLFVFFIYLLNSCIESDNINPLVESVVSFEALYNQDEAKAVVIENSQYQCAIPNDCPPRIVTNATISVRTTSVAGRELIRDDNKYELEVFPGGFVEGDEVTVQALVDEKTYMASEFAPEASDKVAGTLFYVHPDSFINGLIIVFDSAALAKAEAVYVLIRTSNLREPTYGYVITSNLQESAAIPNNGEASPLSNTQYLIPYSELRKANPGFSVTTGDDYAVSIRTITKSSKEFYLAYKRAIVNGEFDLNDGVFFAPPQNLPTNFDNGGFGMFHVYHEQVTTGVVL